MNFLNKLAGGFVGMLTGFVTGLLNVPIAYVFVGHYESKMNKDVTDLVFDIPIEGTLVAVVNFIINIPVLTNQGLKEGFTKGPLEGLLFPATYFKKAWEFSGDVGQFPNYGPFWSLMFTPYATKEKVNQTNSQSSENDHLNSAECQSTTTQITTAMRTEQLSQQTIHRPIPSPAIETETSSHSCFSSLINWASSFFASTNIKTIDKNEKISENSSDFGIPCI